MRRMLSLLTALVAVAVVTPAHADSDASVSVAYSLQSVRVNGEQYVLAYCEATSSTGTSNDMITQTGVVCSVNGLDVQSYGAGNKAYAVATHNLPRPVEFCYQGIAILFDFDMLFTYAVQSPRTCLTY